MKTAMQWWHDTLMHPTYGRSAREWLLTYNISGVMPPPLKQPNSFYRQELGYAPTMLDPHFVRQFVGHMHDMLHESVPLWQSLAAQLGIFNEDGTVRIQDRLVFASTDTLGRMMWFQARAINEEQIDRYINATGVLQHPFRLFPEHIRFPGTCFVKSVKDVFVLYQLGVRAVQLRPSIDTTLFNFYPGPFFLLTHPQLIGEEETKEERQRQWIEDSCEPQRVYRIHFPLDYERVDEWIRAVGVEPLYQQLAEALSRGL
jgi:hypothetical protein